MHFRVTGIRIVELLVRLTQLGDELSPQRVIRGVAIAV